MKKRDSFDLKKFLLYEYILSFTHQLNDLENISQIMFPFLPDVLLLSTLVTLRNSKAFQVTFFNALLERLFEKQLSVNFDLMYKRTYYSCIDNVNNILCIHRVTIFAQIFQ